MNMIQSLIQRLQAFISHPKETTSNQHTHYPKIIQRAQHSISRKNISPNALKVLYRLNRAGFDAYMVGGCVRDLLLGKHPKDFDVATNATPEEVYRLFRNCRLIGRRFKLAHVHFGREIIEVATFRRGHHMAHHEHARTSKSGMILRDNVYGTLEEDAWRRDFSINALYYSIRDFSLLDFTGGLEDLKKRQIRILGNADQRYVEDPIRLIRAIRFAGKLGFNIDENSCRALEKYKVLLSEVPSARLFEEVRKLFCSGTSYPSFQLLRKFELFPMLFPLSHQEMIHHDSALSFIVTAFKNTDARIAEQKPVLPAFLFACMLWPAVHVRAQYYQDNGYSKIAAMQHAASEVIGKQTKQIAIPRRLTLVIKEIWLLQYRLHQRLGTRAFQVLEHPRFRAAYDFLQLRANAGENVQKLLAWWKIFITADHPTQEKMIAEIPRKS